MVSSSSELIPLLAGERTRIEAGEFIKDSCIRNAEVAAGVRTINSTIIGNEPGWCKTILGF